MGLEPTTFCMSSRYRLQSCAASCSGKARFPGERRSSESWRCTAKRSKCTPMLATRLQLEAHVKIRRVLASYQLASERPDAVDEGELAHSVIGVSFGGTRRLPVAASVGTPACCQSRNRASASLTRT